MATTKYMTKIYPTARKTRSLKGRGIRAQIFVERNNETN